MKITLKNIADATKQQVFDQVAAHLLHQGKRSVRSDRDQSCAYRGENGLKCAAGCLIDDAEYTLEFDKPTGPFGTSWASMVKRGLVPVHDTQVFIEELQDLHDGTDPAHYEHGLRRVAETHALHTDVLDKVTLANLEYKTAQQVFDQVAVHLLTQKARSIAEDSTRCMYRGKGGLKCAAGALIADHEYTQRMDQQGSSGWQSLVIDGVVPDVHRQLIATLQGVHDNVEISELRAELTYQAKNFGLNTDAIKGM